MNKGVLCLNQRTEVPAGGKARMQCGVRGSYDIFELNGFTILDDLLTEVDVRIFT